jgi:hypothetical protein
MRYPVIFSTTCVVITLLYVSVSVAPLPVQGSSIYATINPPSLYSFDTTTGKPTPIGTGLGKEGQAQGLGTIDPKTETYYLLGFNLTAKKPNLVGASLKTGVVVSDVALPFAESEFIGVGQTVHFDTATGTGVYVTGRMPDQTSPHHLLHVDPTTGQYTDVAQIGDGDVLGGSSAFDPVAGLYYVQLARNVSGQVSIDIFSINIKTGAVKEVPMSFPNGHELQSMAWDSNSRTIVGFGVKPGSSPSSLERTLVELDPSTSAFRVIASIPQYLVISGGISAYDSNSRTLYGMLQATNGTDASPVHLVGVNANTAKVVSDPVICQSPSASLCPWTLASMQ